MRARIHAGAGNAHFERSRMGAGGPPDRCARGIAHHVKQWALPQALHLRRLFVVLLWQS